MVAWIGPAIAAAGSLIGGIFGQNKADQARAEDLAFQKKQLRMNMKAQRNFAQHGIQWRVRDAKRSGIHPLYALGAQPTSFSPVSVGSPGFAGSPLAEGLASAGQDIGRAVSVGMTHGEQSTAYDKTMQGLSLTRAGLENELLASQIRKINQAGSPPPFPRSGHIELPTGDVAPVGPGAPARVVEDEYGEISDVEGGFRYIRDRVPYYLGLLDHSKAKGSRASVPWLDFKSPFGSFRW